MPCNDCYATAGVQQVFNERNARRDARRFRRRGLDGRATRLLAALAEAAPLEGARSLEIGAGIGGFSLTLLERGVSDAAIVDASTASVAQARALAEERGLGRRLAAEVGDFAAQRTEERYDLVVLDRVVCCYPDWRGLLMPAAASARRALGVTYPAPGLRSRLLDIGIRVGMTLLRRSFRFYVHPPDALHAALREAGLAPRVVGREGIWEIVIATRAA